MASFHWQSSRLVESTPYNPRKIYDSHFDLSSVSSPSSKRYSIPPPPRSKDCVDDLSDISDLLNEYAQMRQELEEIKERISVKRPRYVPTPTTLSKDHKVYVKRPKRYALFPPPPPPPRLLCKPYVGGDRPQIIQDAYFEPEDFLQSSLDMTLLQWEARVPKTDIWRTILEWAKCKQDSEWWQEDRDYHLRLLKQEAHAWFQGKTNVGNDLKLEQKTQALEMVLDWVRRHGKEANKRAEYVLDKRRVRTTGTDIEQHIEQLLKLMEQEYWHQHPRSLDCRMSVFFREEIFKTMQNEIPKLIGKHQKSGLRNPTLEAQFSTTLDKILRLSSWTPSSTHNKHLRELLRNALMMLNDLGGNEEYHDYLRDFMKRHTAFCAFTLDNADVITTEDTKKTAELCKNLRRLAQNLGKIASAKAEQYQKLYENFMAHKEGLSNWLDSASPGQGRSLVDGFTVSLKDMASSMRQEADFWNSQSNQFHKWPSIKQTYGCAIGAMPPFPAEQFNDHRNSTTPSIHGSVIQNSEPDPHRVPQAAQRVTSTFADLQKLRVNTTQAFLAKSENSISKRMRETRGYLEFVVDMAEKQLSEPSDGSIPKVMVRLAEKALCIAKEWNKLQRKMKYWGSFLSIFSKPCQTSATFDMDSGISRDDFLDRITVSPDRLNHPYVIEFELCLRGMWHHLLSRTHFWARIDLDPATLIH